jgi:hypothetical protein
MLTAPMPEVSRSLVTQALRRALPRHEADFVMPAAAIGNAVLERAALDLAQWIRKLTMWVVVMWQTDGDGSDCHAIYQI